MTLDSEQWNEAIGTLVASARAQGGRLDIQDGQGAIAATLTVHELPRRPQDMPRELRPKRKLSMRQRRAARREKTAHDVTRVVH